MKQLPDRQSMVRVLLQAGEQEICGLCRNLYIAGNLNLIFYYFYQLLFFGYPEGVLPNNHLEHHHSKRPDIDLLVVLLTSEDLWSNVERSSTKSRPQSLVSVHRPPKIAQFHHILRFKQFFTSCMTIFSGFISRWII